MIKLEQLTDDIIQGYQITKEQALALFDEDVQLLKKCAKKIQEHFCQNTFDLCTIINAKSGRCPEDCKFCAQSSYYNTNAPTYSLLDEKTIVNDAIEKEKQGVLRYSIVASGKKVNDFEFAQILKTIKSIQNNTKHIKVCVSLGLLSKEQFFSLKEIGVTRIHNNIETSSNYFQKVCSTHSFKDKINAIKLAQDVGLSVCSGGIIGMGESLSDRVDMAFTLKELNIKSIPINILNPIEGTPFGKNILENQELIEKTVAMFRFVNTRASIRLAGGRALLSNQAQGCFEGGANAAITGDMLTTSGIGISEDIKLIKKLGFKIQLQDYE